MKSTAFDMAMMAYRQNDMEGAFRQFLPLAETGDADAMNMAANMFERGQGTYRDRARSVLVEESSGAWKCGCICRLWSLSGHHLLMARSRSLEQGIWLLQRSVETTERERA